MCYISAFCLRSPPSLPASFTLPFLHSPLLLAHCCAASHSTGQPVWHRPQLCLVLPLCSCVLSVGAVLCHAAVSEARAFFYCPLPYGSPNQHGHKPVLMLFPDLLRHPAGTKCRNNYYPNYPGQLCHVFVCAETGDGGNLWSAGGNTVEGGPEQKETTEGMGLMLPRIQYISLFMPLVSWCMVYKSR